VGIKIFKPLIYLGNKEVFLKNILKNKSYDLKNKIGSERIHIETRKSILEMAINVSKKCINLYKINPKFLILVSQGQEKNYLLMLKRWRINVKLIKIVWCLQYPQDVLVLCNLFIWQINYYLKK
jgi:hypothetical protein